MKVGLDLPSFTWPGGDAAIGQTLARVASEADDAGFDSIWVMDHFFQIRGVGPAEDPMLEGWTALGFLAGHTRRATLGLMVGGVHYRHPGLWVKAATTLDVLSGGRAWLGIGAAWNEEESKGLGFPFPPLGERFEILEETLRIAHEMWQGERGSEGAFRGKHYQATRMLNSPQALTKPHPPILIGGGGERKTLRLVAQYADATNVFGGPDEVAHKYAVLKEHCDEIGRDYDEIERTTNQGVILEESGIRVGPWGQRPESVERIVQRMGDLADSGVQHVVLQVPGIADPKVLERIARDLLPQLKAIKTPEAVRGSQVPAPVG
jgi:F420-dependent oxidoreductase-like protein